MNTDPYWAWPPHRIRPAQHDPVNEQAARNAAAEAIHISPGPKAMTITKRTEPQ